MTINKNGDWWEFDNHKLRKALPADLAPEEIGNKEIEDCRAFLLTLGVIFNDLKGLTIFNDTLPDIYRQPPDDEVSSHSGEYNGLRMQLLKILFATLHEFLVFLEKNHKTYEGEHVQSLLSKCSLDTQQIWLLLSKIARGVSPANSEMSEFGELADQLQQIRDNVGFHYQTRNRLLAGLR